MPVVRILQLDLPTLDALAAGDLVTANRHAPVAMGDFFVGPQCLGTWRRRASQVAAGPAFAAWVTGVVVDESTGVAVGRAGYHAPPDERGMVEVGYAIDESFRRHGYARAALEALVERGRREPDVRVVRASIAPANEASLGLIHQYPFEQVGEQWDDEDGVEVLFELVLSAGPCC